jgi:uracil-DNA glycosylase
MKLVQLKADILSGVDPMWLPYLDREEFTSALAGVDVLDGVENVTPPPSAIFEAFRYGGPDDVAAIILGEDPYIQAGQAQGLCFSVPKGTPLPPSLKNVFGCLERAGFLRLGVGSGSNGDLRPWAVDRVLLLNTALTTRLGKSGAHLAEWKPFTRKFMRLFCAAREGSPVSFLLWGGKAGAYAGLARAHGHAVHEWSHPSPMADNQLAAPYRFRECPHFEAVNKALLASGSRAIAWDRHTPVVAFTDGGCSDNGNAKARASYAAVLVGGQFAGCVLRGEVCPYEYVLVDEEIPEKGVHVTDVSVRPSNNRGELLGFVYAFLALLRGRALGRVEIVSDSDICVKTLREWLPNRLKKGTASELKNFDLVMIAWRLLGALREQAADVVLTWTESHATGPMPKEPRARLLREGNSAADAHCTTVLERASGAPTRYHLEALNGPVVVRKLAD